MKMLPFEVVYPDIEKLTSQDDYISNIRFQFHKYREKGLYNKSKKPCFTVCKITDGPYTYTGFCALHATTEMHRILGHENTLTTKEDIHVKQILDNQAMIKPVLVGYDCNEEILNLLNKVTASTPDMVFHFDNNTECQKFWFYYDYAILQNMLSKLDENVFIADGHHRYASYSYLLENKMIQNESTKGLMCTYMGFDQLSIKAYNRCSLLEQLTSDNFIARLHAYGEVMQLSEPTFPAKKHTLLFILNGQCYTFKWHAKCLPQTNDDVFDIDLYNEYILADILNIEDSSVMPYGHYVDGMMSVEAMIKDTLDSKKVFTVFYPITVDELKSVALRGKTLPPKSTWFMPRIKSGIINCDL